VKKKKNPSDDGKVFQENKKSFPAPSLAERESKKSKARKCCANGLNYKSLTTSLIVVVFRFSSFKGVRSWTNERRRLALSTYKAKKREEKKKISTREKKRKRKTVFFSSLQRLIVTV
jgi:hypothetical protein